MQTQYSIADLLALQLPGLPATRQGLEHYIGRAGWSAVTVPGRGGRDGVRREYQPSAEVIAQIKQIEISKTLAALSVVAPQQPATPIAVSRPQSVGPVTDRQRQVADARAAILGYIDSLMADPALRLSRSAAVDQIVTRAAAGQLPAHIAALVPVANARAGSNGGRTLCRRTVYNWTAAAEAVKTAPGKTTALTPKVPQPSMDIPAWALELLDEHANPEQDSLRKAVQKVHAKYGLTEDVLYNRARRFLKKVGNVEKMRGRLGTRGIKTIMPFRRRKTDDLLPGDVYTADGHTFDAEIGHPEHGQAFRPEITGVVDVVSRRCVGWSIDLAESGLAVLDALRVACEIGGIPAIFYVDNGSGYKNAMMSAPATGMIHRLGSTMLHSLPYNSQARGIIERWHKTVWVSAAKELPTYIGKDMDRQAASHVHKLTRAAIKAGKKSPLLMDFPTFVTFCNLKIEEYNNRPHSSLAKVYDPGLGKKRHMTPNEAWAAGIAKAEAEGLYRVEKDEARDLFRPQKECKLARGEIRLHNNKYFNADLAERHGEWVRVAYDVRDASAVLVYDNEGRYLCEAKLDGNAGAYFAKSVVEQNRVKRAQGRMARLELKAAEIQAELDGAQPVDIIMALEDAPSQILEPVADPVAEPARASAPNVVALPVKPAAPVRPIFELDSQRYRWLMQNQPEADAEDWQWLREFVRSEYYRDMADMFHAEGLDWAAHQQKAAL